MSFCHILERKVDKVKGDFVYTVEITFGYEPYNPDTPDKDRWVDKKVPRRAIRFMEIPYMDDEHLSNAFRHPIGLPDHLFPQQWTNTAIAAK